MLGPQQPQPMPIASAPPTYGGGFGAGATGQTTPTFTPQGGAGSAFVSGVAPAAGAVAGSLIAGPLGAIAGGLFGSIGGIFAGGGNARRRTALNEFMRHVQANTLDMNVRRNWLNFGVDYTKHLRDWDIRDASLKGGRAIDQARWNAEDWFRDNQFAGTQQIQDAAFNVGQWRAQALGQLGDTKARFDTDLGNMFRTASTQQSVQRLWADTMLRLGASDAQHLIARNLENSVHGVRDNLKDTRESLSEYMYSKNQQLEDQLYAASLQLGEQAGIRDMSRVTDGWRQKVKMERRASQKLFRGNEQQEQAFKDKVARKQYQAQLLASGDSRGSVDFADPIRARRIAALAQLQGPYAMAAERLTRLDRIGTALDMVEDQFKDDPSSWYQSKKILQFMLDSLEDQ